MKLKAIQTERYQYMSNKLKSYDQTVTIKN